MKLLLVLLSFFYSFFAFSNAQTEPWLRKSLKFQRDIQLDLPLWDSFYLSTHNAYNSTKYGILSYTAQQTLTVTEQLEDGIRFLMLDILVCGGKFVYAHGLCIGTVFKSNAEIKAIFKEITDFMDKNPNETILIDFEFSVAGREKEIVDIIVDSFGSRLYTMREHVSKFTKKTLSQNYLKNRIIPMAHYYSPAWKNLFFNYRNENSHKLKPDEETDQPKELDATLPDPNTPYKGQESILYTSVPDDSGKPIENDNEDRKVWERNSKFLFTPIYPDTLVSRMRNNLELIEDVAKEKSMSISEENTLNPLNTTDSFKDLDISVFMQRGINSLALDMFQGINRNGKTDSRLYPVIWSWARNEPRLQDDLLENCSSESNLTKDDSLLKPVNGIIQSRGCSLAERTQLKELADKAEHVCVVANKDGKWFSQADCTEPKPFACKNRNDYLVWKVTRNVGQADAGMKICRAEFGPNYTYDYPKTTQENYILNSVYWESLRNDQTPVNLYLNLQIKNKKSEQIIFKSFK